jgi:hypothetical protein
MFGTRTVKETDGDTDLDTPKSHFTGCHSGNAFRVGFMDVTCGRGAMLMVTEWMGRGGSSIRIGLHCRLLKVKGRKERKLK